MCPSGLHGAAFIRIGVLHEAAALNNVELFCQQERDLGEAEEIFFPDGQAFSLAAFRKDLPHETGTGRYLKSGGTIQVLQETGTLKGLWNRMGLSSSTGEQVQPSLGDQTSPGTETVPFPSS